jgi:Kef-type K+ transport system membrane component KefB
LNLLLDNLHSPLARLLLQFIIIIVATRAAGAVFARFGQPAVIGEITAGILLGPSLFGWVWPEASNFFFPPTSLGNLHLFSQIGVCVFMFVVGMELELGQVRQRARAALIISSAGIIVPFLLGAGASFWLFKDFAVAGTSFLPFALFMGIALSITAFPVLVRILEARGLTKTPLGAMAIVCAAVNDATAWAILAIVIAIARATGLASTFCNLGLVVGFVALMLFVMRPRLPRWLRVEKMTDSPGNSVMAAVLVLMTLSALTTEAIGIHALFGAFLAGVVMPKNKEFREQITVRLENFSGVFLLPLFFAFSGLRTHLGLLTDAAGWLVCAGIIAVAVAGKLGGTLLAARATGMNRRDAFALGALMNTRGLVELVALNIGYDLGILSPRIFAMMVLMALVTTFMTGPLLNLSKRIKG